MGNDFYLYPMYFFPLIMMNLVNPFSQAHNIAMKKTTILCIMVLTILVSTLTGCGSSSGFRTYKADGDISFKYMLFSPNEKRNMPLVLTFHGFGDTENVSGCRIASELAAPENQKPRPCFVLAPVMEDSIYLSLSEREKTYRKLKEIIDDLIDSGKVDGARIYIAGNSFGGLASIEFTEMYPDSVACALVLCPALTYSQNSVRNLNFIKDVPLTFAHATNDNVIPVTVSRNAVSTLKALGARDVSLIEFSNEEMANAGAVYGYHQADLAVMANDDIMKWMFEKIKNDSK